MPKQTDKNLSAQYLEPPKYLYKYLSADRITNVLEQQTVRFTELINTNDSFEFRKTFDKFLGPKAISILNESIRNKHRIKAAIARKAAKENISPERLVDRIEAKFGDTVENVIPRLLGPLESHSYIESINTPDFFWEEFKKNADLFLAFSLSESMNSSVMWAHYGDNNQGLVLVFDTQSAWFNSPHFSVEKIEYFDGLKDELLDNPNVLLFSKLTEWKHEREWRVIAPKNTEDQIVGDIHNPISLFQYPNEALQRIIVGNKMSAENIERIKCIADKNFPNIKITQTRPNFSTHNYEEIEI